MPSGKRGLKKIPVYLFPLQKKKNSEKNTKEIKNTKFSLDIIEFMLYNVKVSANVL